MDVSVGVVLTHYTGFNNETEDNLNGHLDKKHVGVLSMCLSLSITGSQWDSWEIGGRMREAKLC